MDLMDCFKTKNSEVLLEKPLEIHTPLLNSWLNGYSSCEQVKSGNSQLYIVCYQGRPFGYIKSYSIDPSHPYAKYCRSVGVTMGVDLYIADSDFLKNKGCTEVLRQFVAQLGPGVDRIIADPIIESCSASLFHEYGFKELEKVVWDDTRRCILAIDIRYNARALLMNADKQLLLMKVEDNITVDSSRSDNHFWVTIGGGIEKGEDIIQTLIREIREETGMEDAALGELAFYGQHTLLFHRFPVRLFEVFYFVYVDSGNIHQKNLTDNEKRVFRDIRWWSLPELLATNETFYPRSLAKELDKAFKGGVLPKEIGLS